MRWSNKAVIDRRTVVRADPPVPPGAKRAGQPPPAAAAAVVVPAGATARPMLFLLAVLLVLAYGRLVEKIAIPGLVLGIALVLLTYGVFTNPQFGWTRRQPSLLLAGWTAWMLPSAVFGLWPGGSAHFLVDTWIKMVVFYVLVVTLGRDLGSVRSIMGAMAWATASIVALGLLQSPSETGERLGVGATSLANPNDLAVFLVVGLPFCGWYAADSQRGRLLRLVMGGVVALGLIAVLRTGSRMGLLALLVLMLVVFFAAGRNLKLMIGGAAILLAIGSLIFLPNVIGRRYLTIISHQVDETDESHEVSRAIGSAENRWELFLNSIIVTIHHPLLGVGPGNFSDANAQLGRDEGEKAVWKQAHNSYTQVSAECGIPGGILFTLLVAYCVRSSYRMWKQASRRADSGMAFCLMVASVSYAFCAMFGSLSFTIHLQLLSGLVLALQLALYPKPAGFTAQTERRAR